jgi:uncharacterized membrane protein (DUF2068 family)
MSAAPDAPTPRPDPPAQAPDPATPAADPPTPAPGTELAHRPRRKVDWELVACGFGGHRLVALDAQQLRPEDALIAIDQGPVRWHRCLRCDCWVALAPPARPSRRHPPDRDEIEVPLRGKALRDKVVLRIIAVDRAVHFMILGLLGIGALLFAANEGSLRRAFYRVMTAIQGGVAGGPVQYSGNVGILKEFNKLFTLHSGTLREVGIALLAYAVLEGVEAIGLWYARRWAEYLTFVATTILLAPEIYEIIHGATVLKVVGFLVNLAVVVYLLLAKRLFGLRGGGGADEAQRAGDMSWEAIERSTPAALVPTAAAARAGALT